VLPFLPTKQKVLLFVLPPLFLCAVAVRNGTAANVNVVITSNAVAPEIRNKIWRWRGRVRGRCGGAFGTDAAAGATAATDGSTATTAANMRIGGGIRRWPLSRTVLFWKVSLKPTWCLPKQRTDWLG